jgi:hypothetical protein
MAHHCMDALALKLGVALHLEILKWARKNGSRWHDNEFEAAFRNEHLKVMKWLLDNEFTPE